MDSPPAWGAVPLLGHHTHSAVATVTVTEVVASGDVGAGQPPLDPQPVPPGRGAREVPHLVLSELSVPHGVGGSAVGLWAWGLPT